MPLPNLRSITPTKPLNGESEHSRRMPGIGERSDIAAVSMLELTQRAKVVLAGNGIDTLLKLRNCDASEFTKWTCGPETIREIMRACLDAGIRPKWIGQVAYNLNWEETVAAAPVGYHCLTTVYWRTEAWMVECVLADMRRFNTHAVLVQCGSGVEVWRKGGVYYDEEE